MVSKKKTPVKRSVGKLKLKKETIRDLDAKGQSSEVKGGKAYRSQIEICVIPTK